MHKAQRTKRMHKTQSIKHNVWGGWADGRIRPPSPPPCPPFSFQLQSTNTKPQNTKKHKKYKAQCTGGRTDPPTVFILITKHKYTKNTHHKSQSTHIIHKAQYTGWTGGSALILHFHSNYKAQYTIHKTQYTHAKHKAQAQSAMTSTMHEQYTTR